MLGVFDSGFGGLTVLKAIHNRLPSLSTIYLGDNAHAPYGTRTHDEIFDLTLAGVRQLFERGCPLVILACNSASAQALQRIQNEILPFEFPNRRVLGVIRPAAEEIVNLTRNGHIGILATPATVNSKSYIREISNFDSSTKVSQVACPTLVPLIEAGKHHTPEASQAVKSYIDEIMSADKKIDTILLACTHYPLVLDLFEKYSPTNVQIISQGDIVADKLAKYLRKHSEIKAILDQQGQRELLCDGDDCLIKANLFYPNANTQPLI